MNPRRQILTTLLAAATGPVLAADAARTVTDMAQRRVALPARIERVVTLVSLPVLNSFVFTLGEGRRIVNGLADFAKPHWKYPKKGTQPNIDGKRGRNPISA